MDVTLTGDQDIDLSGEAGTDGNSRNTNDTITGGEGDNTIVAGPDLQVTESETNKAGKTQTYDVQDNDTIVESSGTNELTGGYGNDTFKFVIDFSVTTQTFTHEATYDVAAPGISGSANLNGQWNSWMDGLAAWRAQMAAEYGVDENTDTVTTAYKYANNSKKGYQDGSKTYDNDFSWTTTETAINSNTSTNTITDFGNGSDNIVLAGVTADQFASYGHVTQVGDDTVITIGNFTIVVAGATADAVSSALTFG
jgi:hypothetical protein